MGKSLLLAALVGVTAYLAQPLGGMLFAAVSLTNRIPYLGRVFRLLLLTPLRLAGVVKLGAWLVSSSGVLLGLLLYIAWMGPPTGAADPWILLGVAGFSLVHMVDELVYFRITGPNEIAEGMAPWAGRWIGHFHEGLRDTEVRLSLFRSVFVDMYLPRFFNMLVNVGVVYFALGTLGVLRTTGGKPPTLSEALLTSLTLNGVLGSFSPPFQGDLWSYVQVASSFLVFYWLTIFISFVASTPERDHGEYREPTDTIEQFRAEVEAMLARHAEAAGGASPEQAALRVVEAAASASPPPAAAEPEMPVPTPHPRPPSAPAAGEEPARPRRGRKGGRSARHRRPPPARGEEP